MRCERVAGLGVRASTRAIRGGVALTRPRLAVASPDDDMGGRRLAPFVAPQRLIQNSKYFFDEEFAKSGRDKIGIES